MYGSNKDPCYLFPEIFFRESNPPTIRYEQVKEMGKRKERGVSEFEKESVKKSYVFNNFCRTVVIQRVVNGAIRSRITLRDAVLRQ